MGSSIPGFPADMELPSPDALFQDRRDDPGMATGFGKPVVGLWLGEAARQDGAPIPVQIADQLRGVVFRNFHEFRRAFWRAVAADGELGKQFNNRNLKRMRTGRSPFSLKIDQVGGRENFELHHHVEVANGGAVYGMDEISVMTPRRHIQLHGRESENDL